jgi:uncharacterized protein (DUF433 family)
VAQTHHLIDEIVSDPKIRGGQPVIKGTGIRVIDLVAYHIGTDQMDAAQLAESFHLDRGQVHAALAYYYLHKSELEGDMRAESERAEVLLRELQAQGKLGHIEIDLNEAETVEE